MYRSSRAQGRPDWDATLKYKASVKTIDQVKSERGRDIYRWFQEKSHDGLSVRRDQIDFKSLGCCISHVSLVDLIGDPVTDVYVRIASEYVSKTYGRMSNKLISECLPLNVFENWLSAFVMLRAEAKPVVFNAPVAMHGEPDFVAESVLIPVGDSAPAPMALTVLDSVSATQPLHSWEKKEAAAV